MPADEDFEYAHISDPRIQGIYNAAPIYLMDAHGQPTYWPRAKGNWFKEIGRIFVRAGRIEIWPHQQLHHCELDELRSMAVDAHINKPTKRDWRLHRTPEGTCWKTTVSIPASDDDADYKAIRRAEAFKTEQDRMLDAIMEIGVGVSPSVERHAS